MAHVVHDMVMIIRITTVFRFVYGNNLHILNI